jgi:aerobic carbon-monoxide dehydrogenase medium subunit
VKPAPFEYHAPDSVDDVVALLAEHGDDAKPLAGGQSLVPLLSLRLTRFDHLVDLNGVAALQGVRRANGHLEIGAMTRQRAVEQDADATAAVPLLGLAIPHIGHFQIRNRGTIGGSLAHADPASELPAVAAALDAEFVVESKGASRTVGAADFFQGTFMTAIDTGELLTAVRLPVWGAGAGFGFAEFARRGGDFAVVGVAAAVQVGGGNIQKAAIAFSGMGGTPVRASDAEAALVGSATGSVDLEAAGQAAVAATDPQDDVHASAANRRRIGAHLVERALRQAIANAQGN